MISLRNKSEFGKNVLTLFTGQVLSQGIPIIIAPLLARIYSPADFGVADVVMAIVSIIASVACGNYEQAILLPEDNKKGFLIAGAATILCSIVSGTVLLIVVLFRPILSSFVGLDSQSSYYLFFVPVIVWLVSLFMVLRYYNLRSQHYRLIAKAMTIKSIFLTGVQLLVGILKASPLGLLVGQLSSNVFSNKALLKTVKNHWKMYSNEISRTSILSLAIEYINFPKFSVPGTLANTLVLYLPSVFISKVFSLQLLGFIALTNRILNVPLNVIASAVGDAFMQKLSRLTNDTKSGRGFFLRIFGILSLVSAVAYIFGVFLLKPLIVFVFGNNWEYAGELGGIMLPLFAIRFICIPLSKVLIVFQKQRLFLYLTSVQLLILVSTFLVTYLAKLSFEGYFRVYIYAQFIFYCFYLFICFWVVNHKSRMKNNENLKNYKID
ncbi:hypothetical protein COR50_03160 [Chitinophaga caeni]|uniref:Polysaccharide biosynthesis protein n=1 Tax=Chitinophaga caeni TaxID=2029983 RepID=A0A291QQH5_9BACT|nr:oligosaccharide flippase family protein [Chitinophaga caeni]ATL46248.1 hypothetical protein COR50_03160 [Chitinophaga caeni]